MKFFVSSFFCSLDHTTTRVRLSMRRAGLRGASHVKNGGVSLAAPVSNRCAVCQQPEKAPENPALQSFKKVSGIVKGRNP